MDNFTLENVPKEIISLLTIEEIGILLTLLTQDEVTHQDFEKWVECEDTLRIARVCYYLLKPYYKEV